MGKNLIQQARGKGTPTYLAPSFRYAGKALHFLATEETLGMITELVHCPGHSAPLVRMKFGSSLALSIAPEGVRVGEMVKAHTTEIALGNSVILKDIPEGTFIYNVEATPGDGGKFVRASGTFAKVLSRTEKGVLVEMPSKKTKTFSNKCLASIGIVAGGGRVEKPFLKAGRRFYKQMARNKKYPDISGGAQNAVDHPFGNKRSSRKGHAVPASRHAPPGRKVGMIAARRSGRKK